MTVLIQRRILRIMLTNVTIFSSFKIIPSVIQNPTMDWSDASMNIDFHHRACYERVDNSNY